MATFIVTEGYLGVLMLKVISCLYLGQCVSHVQYFQVVVQLVALVKKPLQLHKFKCNTMSIMVSETTLAKSGNVRQQITKTVFISSHNSLNLKVIYCTSFFALHIWQEQQIPLNTICDVQESFGLRVNCGLKLTLLQIPQDTLTSKNEFHTEKADMA